jgi:multidrug efflux pump subunit AcrA (membrane-fusion protein)
MNRSQKILVSSTVVVIAVLAFAFWWSHSRKWIKAHPKSGPLVEAIYGLGKVRSAKVFEFKLGTTVGITKIHKSEGSQALKGDLLVEFADLSPLRAPFDGTITSLPYHEGENLFPQTPILRIEDLKQRFIEVSLEQQGAMRVQPGQRAKISFETLRNQVFEGTIQSRYPFNDQFLVRIDASELPDSIIPGMTGDVAITVSERDSVVQIPLNAVENGEVLRLRDGKKERVSVEIGAIDGTWGELKTGDLKPSDELLVRRDPSKL